MAKLAKRKAEKQARTSGLTVYEEIYTFHRNLVNCLLDKKKQHFFREKVTESKSDYKCLFKLFNMLLNKSSEISLPTNKSSPS